MKRLLDIVVASLALLLLWPFFGIIAIAVALDSKGGAFYRQKRIGKGENPFWLYKFRTMQVAADREGLLSLGQRDTRITRVGHFLRRYKLDELPQLWNVLKGDMSLVGPRPEVAKYVRHYTTTQKETLQVRPGLTGYAALEYLEEDEILGRSEHPEETYLREILPKKLSLSRRYLKEQSFWTDLKIIGKTILRILGIS